MEMIDLEYYKVRKNFSLEISLKTHSRIILLAGPSGSGKTTLLRCMAGLEKTEKSRFILNEKCIEDSENNKFLIPQKRKAGYLNQHYLLFPHKNIRENLNFVCSDDGFREFDWVLKDLEIESFLDKMPRELSGGQRQRIALAQVIFFQPDYFLLDEPFSALNFSLKRRVCRVIDQISREKNIPVILSTHDLGAGTLLGDISWVYIEDGKFIPGDWKFNPVTQNLHCDINR